MVIVNSGGEEFYLDGRIKKNLDRIKHSVVNKGFDYICVVSGYPGTGKSTFAQQMALYLDETFNTEEDIYFEALGKDGMIEGVSNKKKFKVVMLDESFQDLNSKVGMGSAFVKIINTLQLVRQKNLFIILCLPNFFDLNKAVALFRTRHLFVVYADENFNRGSVACFDREAKKKLYVLGQKFMNYGAAKANFVASFTKKWVVDKELYDKRKAQHLIDQGKQTFERTTKAALTKNKLIFHLKKVEGWTSKRIADIAGITPRAINAIVQVEEEKLETN